MPPPRRPPGLTPVPLSFSGFPAADLLHGRHTSGLYPVMGVITTAACRAFEFGCNHLFHTKEMGYRGGLIGLGVGYWAKCHLDKRYVFQSRAP